uniref:Serpin 3 n=1 Tax=Myxobolus cerebralis TaxID=59783 RepID=A0A7M3V7B4_9CNID|nr:serpin 3 [Myxobolus cerebralis]
MDLSSKINDFGFNMMKVLARQNQSNSNIAFSSPCVYFVLAFMEMGAKENTLEELKKVTGEDFSQLLNVSDKMSNNSKDLVNRLESLLTSMKGSTEYFLKIFHEKKIDSNFKQQTINVFNSEYDNINFGDTELAVKTINKWVEEKTRGHIKKLFENFPEAVNFVVVNTLRFKSDWIEEFDPYLTEEESFYIDEKNTHQVEMMRNLNSFNYTHDGKLKLSALFMPFVQKGMFAVFILPDVDQNLNDVLINLKGNDIEILMSQSKPTNVDAYIPKMNLFNRLKLKKSLQIMGARDMFSPFIADFSGISSTQTSLFDIIQCVSIRIDEKGADASAATGSIICSDGPPLRNTIVFKLNRPFMVMIFDSTSGMILFTNCVWDASEN